MIQMEADDGLDWIALLNENTEIDLKNLNDLVQKKSFKPREQALFFGKALKDKDPTIIHHFSQEDLLYPDLEAGIFMSRKLVMDLWRENQDDSSTSPFPRDFNIDPSYEFAKYVFNDGKGVALENIPQICTQKASGCITFSRNKYSCLKKSDAEGIQKILSETYVAVKTCTKFHEDRLQAVSKTWGPLVKNIEMISDTVDDNLNTIVLPYTVNTENGHCNKTLAILEHFSKMEDTMKYLVIVDDDTILSVSRLAQLLSCYSQDESFLLGQRYGYMAATGQGYNYITGGGGMVLSRSAVLRLLAPPTPCSCPAENTPDDMHLGRCAMRAEIPVLHSNRMFQARPPDYAASILASRVPVSFHKHWEISPYKVYDEFFLKSDKVLLDLHKKDEL